MTPLGLPGSSLPNAGASEVRHGGGGGSLRGWVSRRSVRGVSGALAVVVGATLAQLVVGEPAAAQVPVPAVAPSVQAPGEQLSRPDEMSARVTAKSRGVRVEVESLRDEFSTTWVDSDGSLVSQVHAGQIRYRDDAGAWKDVDLSLEAAPDGSVEPAKHPADLSFGDGATAAATAGGAPEAITLAEGEDAQGRDRTLKLGWQGNLPEPKVEGSGPNQEVVYPEVEPGVDMRIQPLRGGFEQHFVIKERPEGLASATIGSGEAAEPVSFTMPIKTAGLTARLRGSGTEAVVEFVDTSGAKDVVVSTLSAPAAWDAERHPVSGDPVNLSPVTLSVEQKGSGKALVTVTPDQEWLADPVRVFPVVVDPTYLSATASVYFDTFVQSGVTTDQSGLTELRVGTYDSGTTKARSFIKFNTAAVKGKKIRSATMNLYATHSYSCTAKAWQLWTSYTATTSSRWTAQPDLGSLQSTSTATKGYSSSCAAGWVSIDAKDFVQYSADNDWDYAQGALLAASETDSYGWKKFASSESSNDPYITIKYDRKPGAGSAPTVRYTRSWNNATYASSTTPFLGSTASDPDGDTVRFNVEVRSDKTGSSTSLVTSCQTGYIASGGTLSIPASTSTATSGAGWCRPDAGTLTDGSTYHVRVSTYDGLMWGGVWSPWSTFTVGATAPLAPTVSCPSPYSNGSWQDTVPASEVSCTVNVPSSTGHTGANAPVRALVKLDGGPETAYEVTPGTSAAATVKVPATGGGHSIVVRSQTASSWVSPTVTHTFGYGAGIISPVNGATSNDAFSLSAAIKAPTSGTVSGKLQWRNSGGTDAWTDSTLALSPAIASGGAAVNNVTWRAGSDITGTAARTPQLLDLQVCFTFSATSTTTCTWNASKPVTVLKVPHAFGNGYPTSDAGPGQVALFTGEFAASATDASVPGYTGDLTVSRSHSTFNGRTDSVTGVFGPGWTANLDGPMVGGAGLQVLDATGIHGTISLVEEDGFALTYRQPSKGRTALETGTYTPVGDDTLLEGAKLVLSTAGSGTSQTWTLTFTEDDGTVTTWKRGAAGTSTATWAPHAVGEPGVAGQTTFGRDGAGRVIRILAAPPPGVTCPLTGTLVAGCRALEITYAASTTATSTTPGDVSGQVKQIAMTLFDPDKSGGAGMSTTAVATYLYDASSRLVKVTDPRSNLATQYAYAGTNASQTDPVRITSVTPAGLKGFRLGYTASPYKLSTVSRDDVAGGSTPSRLATFVYDIDATASTVPSGLPDLRAATVATWGQAVAPTKGYAVFGADRTPAGTTPSTVTAADWPFADLQYTDALGYTVNTASYGAGAWQRTATDYDQHRNTVRSWDARGIAAALLDGNAANADAYATTTRYNGDLKNASNEVVTPAGALVTDSWGPARQVLLADGTSVLARPHTHTDYDQGAPNSGINSATGLPYWLPTKVTLGAAGAAVAPVNPATAVPADLETVSTATTSYDKIVTTDPDTWALSLPTKQATVVDGTTANDIARITRYDAEGRVIQTRQPKSSGSDAGTINTTYYTASGTYNASTAPCSGKPEWAGLICRVAPAAAPDTGPTLPTTTTTKYSALLAPATVVETSGSSSRTTSTTFLSDGRVNTVTTTSSGITGSTAVPAVTTTYDTTTGLGTKTSTSTTDYTQTGYDTWGRATSYRNSLGESTTITYVGSGSAGAGAVNVVTDPKGTTTYGFGNDANGAVERRGMPTSVAVSGAGTVTGAYDASGTLVVQTMPGGIRQEIILDDAGKPVGLTYKGDVTTEGSTAQGTWVAWSQTNDITGRVRTERIPEGSAVVDDTANAFDREYVYDKAGRLTTVKDRTSSTGALPTDSADPGWAAAACATRVYGFDKNGNRTSLASYAGASDGTCQTSTGATTKSWTHDTADRITTSSGYAYDTFGRATTIPAGDSPSGAALTLGYYDTDAARTITSGSGTTGTTTTYTLDPAGRRLQATTTPASGGTATATVVRHYTDTSDNPGWIADTTANTLTRYGQDLGGDLSAEITTTGVTTASPTTTAKVTLIDPHGDLAATATIPASGNAAGIDSWSDTTEYGLPRAGTTTPTDPGRYNWLGGKQRATDTTGLLLMGARLYNPTTGQFTSTDPVPAGNDTAYSYPSDPINIFDLDGRIATSDVWQVLAEAGVCMSVGITGCAKIIAISIRALRVTRRLLPREKNAVRHFIWQGAMTYYVGFAAAAAVGASHEVGEAVGISSDSSKDKYNNRVGRRWATVHDTQLKWKNFFGGMSSVVAYLKRAGRILYRQRKLKR